MNIQQLAADIASRIPAMAQDSPTNNATVIEGLLKAEFANGPYFVAPMTEDQERRFLEGCQHAKITAFFYDTKPTN